MGRNKNSGAECLKYWKAGFNGRPIKRAIVFRHGDVVVGVGKARKNSQTVMADALKAAQIPVEALEEKAPERTFTDDRTPRALSPAGAPGTSRLKRF